LESSKSIFGERIQTPDRSYRQALFIGQTGIFAFDPTAGFGVQPVDIPAVRLLTGILESSLSVFWRLLATGHSSHAAFVLW
jgi:hypothetical protein